MLYFFEFAFPLANLSLSKELKFKRFSLQNWHNLLCFSGKGDKC